VVISCDDIPIRDATNGTDANVFPQIAAAVLFDAVHLHQRDR